MKELEFNVFENIKHIDEEGNEYWSARELQKVLEYKRWDKFNEVIDKAIKSCINSKYNVLNHFSHVGKMVHIGSNTSRIINDYHLSRYACYLIAQNGDPRKKSNCSSSNIFCCSNKKTKIENYKIIEESEENYERIRI